MPKSMLRLLPGRYALGTWWLSNMRCCGGVVAGNSQFGRVTTYFVVAEGRFEVSNRGQIGSIRGRFEAPIFGKRSRWP